MTDEQQKLLNDYQQEVEKCWNIAQKDFDALQKRLAEPPDPKVVERFREIMSKRAPWDEEE